MNDMTNSPAPPPAEAGAGVQPGRALASARVSRGLSLEQVAESLRYAPRQITALEYDDYGALPGPTTVRGMVRAYAKLVGLDPGPLLDGLRPRLAAPPSVAVQQMAVPFPRRADRGHRSYLVWSIVLLVVGALVLAEWKFGGDAASAWLARLVKPASSDAAGGGEVKASPANATTVAPVGVTAQPLVGAGETSSGTAPRPEAVPAPEADSTPADSKPAPVVPVGHRRVLLRFERDSWTQVRSGSGELIVNGTQRAGTELSVSGAPPIQFVIGAATGVKLTYDDAPVDIAPHTKVDVARFTLE